MGTGLTGVLLCAGITVALAVACILIGRDYPRLPIKCYLITNKMHMPHLYRFLTG